VQHIYVTDGNIKTPKLINVIEVVKYCKSSISTDPRWTRTIAL